MGRDRGEGWAWGTHASPVWSHGNGCYTSYFASRKAIGPGAVEGVGGVGAGVGGG